jgi:hypothetical protein
MGWLRCSWCLCICAFFLVSNDIFSAEPTIPLYLYNGNVGVGIDTPSAAFHVNGTFVVGDSVTPSMVVGVSGNVGVGAAASRSKLHVVGGVGALPVSFFRSGDYGPVIVLGTDGAALS